MQFKTRRSREEAVRAVVQRVVSARILIGQHTVGVIGPGLLVFAGVEQHDGLDDIKYIAEKVKGLRIFDDEAGKMNLSLTDVGGAVLVVSEFTLCGDCRRGRRPSFDAAIAPALAKPLYEGLIGELRSSSLKVETGEFQAHMRVELANDGPVTILLDSQRRW